MAQEFAIPVNPEDLLILGQGPFAIKQKLNVADFNESKLSDVIGGTALISPFSFLSSAYLSFLVDLSDALRGEKVTSIVKSKYFDQLFSICAYALPALLLNSSPLPPPLAYSVFLCHQRPYCCFFIFFHCRFC